MTALQEALDRIARSADGPEVGAFFDFDGTLIDGYSASAYVFDRIRRRDMDWKELWELLQTARKPSLSEEEFRQVIGKGVLDWAGRPEAQIRRMWQRLFQERIGSTLFPEAWHLVHAHQRKGHTVAIASSATPYQIEPLATEYGVDNILCTRPRLRNGRLTGGIDGVVPWGEGKARTVREFAQARNIDLSRSFGYANGDEDIPFLGTVGHPTTVQAKPRLEACAQERCWPGLVFERRNRGPAPAVARTVGAYAAMGASFLGGLAYFRATGKRRQAVDLITAVSSEAALAVLGVEVNVVGEEHLWAHRPCVFIINHQSKFDMFLMMYLIRRGFSGVAKKEAAGVPGFGTFMRMADMAFIDRSNRIQAIDALKPAIEILKKGLCVVMAPEGTRSWTPKMGRFKKGAFYMAMQAGVPVVPVVIRNAGEIMGRNDQVMRSGRVDVAVLPAIEVRGWKKNEMERQIEEVRQLFIQTLEHWPRAAPAADAATSPGESMPA